jgi:hypothetical protein
VALYYARIFLRHGASLHRGRTERPSRVRGDLDNLADLLPNAVPFCLRHTDYPWRLEVDKKDWAFAVAKMAMEIDYRNFKSTVAARQGRQRSYIYGALWWELLALEDLDPNRPEKDYTWLYERIHADDDNRLDGTNYDTGGVYSDDLVERSGDEWSERDDEGPGVTTVYYTDDDDVEEVRPSRKRRGKKSRRRRDRDHRFSHRHQPDYDDVPF